MKYSGWYDVRNDNAKATLFYSLKSRLFSIVSFVLFGFICWYYVFQLGENLTVVGYVIAGALIALTGGMAGIVDTITFDGRREVLSLRRGFLVFAFEKKYSLADFERIGFTRVDPAPTFLSAFEKKSPGPFTPDDFERRIKSAQYLLVAVKKDGVTLRLAALTYRQKERIEKTIEALAEAFDILYS